MRKLLKPRTAVVVVTAGVAIATATTMAAASGNLHAGPQGDGTSITPVGWRVTPAGQQTDLGDKPFAMAKSPDGRFLLVVNDGVYKQSVMVVDAASRQVVQTITYMAPEAVYGGVAFSADGKHAYVTAGGSDKVRVYDVAGEHLTETDPIKPVGAGDNPYPAGLAVAPDGKTLYVSNQLTDKLSVVDLTSAGSAKAYTEVAVGHNPYAVATSPDGRSVYVANQGADTVSVLDAATKKVTATVTVGTHPDAITVDPRKGTVYVANGDSDDVSVIDPATRKVVRTIGLAPYPGAPVGSNPTSLALSADAGTLYVTNAGDNAVDVIRLSGGQHGDTIMGVIPTGWYPTAVSAIGGRLFVANAKGLGAGPNPEGPSPYTDDKLRYNPATADKWASQYVGSMIKGTLSTIPVPDQKTLSADTRKVRDNDRFAPDARSAPQSSIIPGRPGGKSPIKHVIYIVKENRTYDQVLGSLGKGNGDPKLNLFGDESAPNARALARKFVTLDNLYASAEVSADGWNWSTGANANPYVQQSWLANYGGRNKPYDFEGGNLATAPNKVPTNAYLWDRLSAAKVPYRNYGFFSLNNILDPTDPVLTKNSDTNFHNYDLNCPDSAGTFTPHSTRCGTPRVEEWKREFQQYVQNNNLPTAELLRLPSDHTHGTSAGFPTPRAYVADNDYALGQVVDTVSHSKYWKSTAIFAVEDDAQAGPDHVDGHRMVSQVISPYTQTGKVDSTFYSTVSVLRTIELLTGLRPMTQFDAAADPMTNAFTANPNNAPYTAIKPDQSILSETNGSTAPLAAQSGKQDFSKEDRANPQVLNEAIWQSVKGTSVPYPSSPHGTTALHDSDG
jgi:YVTN family beta-propeller protein